MGTADNPATLDVPAGYHDHYAAKFDGNMFYGGYFTLASGSGVSTPVSNSLPFDVYSLSGVLMKRGATSLKQLPRGVYIVNGQKVVVK